MIEVEVEGIDNPVHSNLSYHTIFPRIIILEIHVLEDALYNLHADIHGPPPSNA